MIAKAWLMLGVGSLSATLAACETRPAGAASTATSVRATDASAKEAAVATVVLVANLGEAEASCGCGQIIRAVRAAAARGVRTREIDARNRDDLVVAAQRYKVLVQPAVVMVDAADAEVRRYDGESKETVASLVADLDRLASRKR